jgi:hypothetical protein
VLPAGWREVEIATDGILDLPSAPGAGPDLARFGDARLVDRPDALRRELARLTRAEERILWGEGRVARVAALLQDDCAIAVIRRVSEETEGLP